MFRLTPSCYIFDCVTLVLSLENVTRGSADNICNFQHLYNFDQIFLKWTRTYKVYILGLITTYVTKYEKQLYEMFRLWFFNILKNSEIRLGLQTRSAVSVCSRMSCCTAATAIKPPQGKPSQQNGQSQQTYLASFFKKWDLIF